jgi:hypothetical protein
MCLTVASKNISSVTGLYGMPDPLKEVLLRAVAKADQLRTIEEDDDSYDYASHWQRLIAADFPVLAQRNKWAPKNPKHWSRVYDRYKKTDDDETAAATQRLAATMQGATQAREAQKLQVKANLAKRLPPPPQPKKHWASQSAPPPPRKSALSKLRTQVKSQANRFKAAPITHYGLKLGQVERAPQTMINEARIARQPSIRGLDASKRASGNAQTPFSHGIDKAREEREQRLRQIKSQGAAPVHQNVLDFGSDDESYSSSQPPKRSHLEDFFAERESGLVTPPGSSQLSIGANPTRRSTLLSAAPGSNRPPQRSATIPNEPSTAPAVRRRTGLLSASPGANKTHGAANREKSTRADLSPPSQAKKRTFSESADDSNSDGADAHKRPRTSASPPTQQRPGGNLSAAPGANRTHGNAANTSAGRLPPSGAVKREKSPEDVKQILDKLSGPKFAAPAPLRKRPVSVLVQPKRTFRR